MLFSRKRPKLPAPEMALKGRPTPLPTAEEHFIFGRPLKGPYPAGLEMAMFGMGCFWGVERKFWELGSRNLGDGGRLRRRLHAQRDL